ncbi:MAG TPA: hypothetical protein PLP61_00475 [Nocardioides sp.]|uniref:hypothetical protein n=1 Tax=Nocardioides sp. TaxID=35761 RepID=UPI002CCE3E6F|nr:hypothetical protein [Nocardioides sp.]HQR25488.1 hypothetical protein [Nocardioides sp.]
MSRKKIGYFEGTDSSLLTALICDGHDTLPVSNGRDNHGRNVRLINDKNRVDLLIAYVHKIVAPEGEAREKNDVPFQELFHICRIYEIPLLLETPTALQPKAAALLESPPDIVRMVDPSDALDLARRILADG